jgi:hypothetical protein
VLTTAHQLFSLKSKNLPTSIKFYLNNGSIQEEFDVEKAYFSEAYQDLEVDD